MSNPNDKIKRLAFNLKKNPNDSFSKFALALELLKRDQVTKAVVLFESILKQDSDYLGVYYHLGKLYQRMGNHQQAGELFNSGIELAKDQKNRRTELELSEALENLKIETDHED